MEQLRTAADSRSTSRTPVSLPAEARLAVPVRSLRDWQRGSPRRYVVLALVVTVSGAGLLTGAQALASGALLVVYLPFIVLVALLWGLAFALATSFVSAILYSMLLSVPETSDDWVRLAIAVTAWSITAVLVAALRNASLTAFDAVVVSDREKQATEEAYNWLRSVLDTVAVGIYLRDPSGTVTFANPAARHLVGERFDDSPVTYPGWTITDANGKIVEEADLPSRKVLEHGTAIHDTEVVLRSADGRTLHLITNASALYDTDGQLLGSVTSFANATARVQATHQLELSEKRYRALVELLPTAVFVNSGSCWSFANQAAAELLGAPSPEVIVGRTVLDAIHPDYHAEVRNRIARARQGAVLPPLQEKFLRLDGVPVDVEVVGAPFIDAEGEEAVLVAVRDVSGEKRAREEIRALTTELERRVQERTAQLEAAYTELESFSYAVSHDLRAPLRSIDGFSQAVLEDYSDRLDDDGRDMLERVRGATQRMGVLIDDLLLLSRVTRSELQMTDVDLSALVVNVSEQLQRDDPGRRVELVVAGNVQARGDERLLRIMLENLLGNAWKFTSKNERSRIEFGVLPGATPEYYVVDDGVGFDPAYADKLFAPFQRLHTSAEFPGTGIGLATVQRIVRRHGGRIRVEATSGRGATFLFTLNEFAPKGDQEAVS